jgi:hypothetical protein
MKKIPLIPDCGDLNGGSMSMLERSGAVFGGSMTRDFPHDIGRSRSYGLFSRFILFCYFLAEIQDYLHCFCSHDDFVPTSGNRFYVKEIEVFIPSKELQDDDEEDEEEEEEEEEEQQQ